MKLWHLHRAENDQGSWDTFDSMVVAAETEEEARLTHPYGDRVWTGKRWKSAAPSRWDHDDTWTAPGKLIVREIGVANEGEKGVVCASFNAG